ncbi:MAG: hypothetical protein ACK40G_04905 [Cytophagaceae bacterium]
MNRSIAFFIVFLLCNTFLIAGGNRPSENDPAEEEKSGRGVNVKLSPAFFWKTVGLEFEFPLAKRMSIGLNLFYKYGNAEGVGNRFIIKEEGFPTDGYRAELALKFYLVGHAPEGFYVQLDGFYNQLMYFDGNSRPFTLHNNWDKLQYDNSPSILEKPNPIGGGLGIGYQLVFIPKHLIGNVTLGVQGNQDLNNNLFFTVYLAPSLGIRF